VQELLRLVGLNPNFTNVPPSFSGGQRQRIGIARPGVNLIHRLREAVSALDVSSRRRSSPAAGPAGEFNLTYLFIATTWRGAHCLSRIAVMYLGKIVETAGGTISTTTRRILHQGAAELDPCRIRWWSGAGRRSC